MLSQKLALLEASESLSEAATTLSAAAQAMSKAAKYLAMASSHLAEGSFPTAYTLSDYYHPALNDNSLWQQPEYHLPGIQVTSDTNDRNELKATPKIVGESGDRSEVMRTHPLDSSNEHELHSSIHHGYSVDDAIALPSTGGFQQQASAHSLSKDQPMSPVAIRDTVTGVQAPNQKEEDYTNNSYQQSPEISCPTSESPDTPTELLAGTFGNTSTPAQTTIAAPEELTVGATPLSSSSSVLLDSGFDYIPALCFLSQMRPKTICFYKYWASVFDVGICVRKNTDQTVIIPASLKQNKMLEAANSFASSSTGLLLWPFGTKLNTIEGLELDPDIQVIHLGKPFGNNADVKATQVVVVLASSELMSLDTHERTEFIEQYPLNDNTPACNDQEEHSILHSARMFLRGRLARLPIERSFYIDWFVYHRTHYPAWSPNELVKRANDYANEFLLRGDSSVSGNLIGGQIPLPAEYVKNWKLEPAVQSGALLVG
ncbi:hypothetical protein BDV93DRAFT_220592 [Ceratobasidium sp. AG-I]|nr:hypothetical protein BDV93DRAFT_220592 [Ceratobasidium sp. AG-I]